MSINAQVIGDRGSLGQKPMGSPASVEKKPVTYQTIGDKVPLGTTPVSSPSAVASKGDYQVIGDRCMLSHQANKTVGNSNTLPTSDRAISASGDVPPVPNAKVTR